MSFPLFKFGFFNEEIGLVMAVVIGIGFGFFLERAGFGSANKLVSQFYFRDMAVFKVMFTAIVTAMLGVFFLTTLGFIDFNLIYLTDTYMLPQLTGGLLLGVGFVVGGYCPGTSCVSAATGKIDGLVYLLGVIFGIFAFGEAFSLFEGFYKSTPMGRVTLFEFFNVSYGLIVFLVVLMALGGFWAAEKAEAYFAKKDGKA